MLSAVFPHSFFPSAAGSRRCCRVARVRLQASLLCGALLAPLAMGQAAPSAQTSPRLADTPPTLTFLLRERTNTTQWFAATPNPEVYGHQDSLLRIGLQQRHGRFDYALELGQSAELFLPTDAVVAAPAAQGQLGLGGSYYAANGNNQFPAAASLRQAFLRVHSSHDSATARLGRFEFFEGQETTPKDPTLAWLQTNRIAQRLVGNFGFTNAQRSFDGIDAHASGTHWDLTGMAGRAVGGVFNMNANPEINVDLQYLAYTRTLLARKVLVRGFALDYHDGRTGVLKVDNRPAAVRALDHRNIRLGTYGADATAALPVGPNTVDLLFWGALQNGNWGTQTQHAGAFALEGGLRLSHLRTQPWVRGGAFRSTGDSNAGDNLHNTFFQLLPTPRVYARFPYFNLMNSKDEFIQLLDKPTAKLDLRTDLHFLQLTAPTDLWYSGGGAFDNKVFGYQGRPGNNHGSLSSLYDISADYAVSRQVSLTAYYAHAFGRTTVAAIYPRDRDAQFGYLELNYRFRKSLVGQNATPSAR